MTLYYILWGISMVIMALPINTRKGYKRQIICCFLPLFLFGAFRVDFGNDYAAYEHIFQMIHNTAQFQYDPNERIEFGYLLLNFLCPSFRWLLIITSALVSITYISFFYNYIPQKYRLLAIFLLYLSGNNTVFFMFSGIRNSIAICILLLSIPLVQHRKLLWYCAAMLLAMSFHVTAVFVFPLVYAISYFKNFTKNSVFLIIAAAVVLWFLPFEVLLEHLGNLISLYSNKYETYLFQAEEIGKGASMLVGFSNIIIISIISITMRGQVLSDAQRIILVIGLIGFFAPLLGTLDFRLSIFFSLISISSIIVAFQIIRNVVIRWFLVGLFAAYRTYSFFIIFLNNPYFSYDHIHNLLLE